MSLSSFNCCCLFICAKTKLDVAILSLRCHLMVSLLGIIPGADIREIAKFKSKFFVCKILQ